MNPSIRRRLDAVEEDLGQGNWPVVFVPLQGETNEQRDARLERWKAGEEVEGITRPYTGREKVIVVRFIAA